MGAAAPLVDLETITFVGRGLNRPECVVCDADGVLHVSDWRGGVTKIAPDGSQTSILTTDVELRPNGVWLEPDGSYLIAHLGADTGGIFRLNPDGTCTPVLTELNGEPLPPSNYALRDGKGRIWLTVSTHHRPRADAYRGDIADGFVVLIDDAGARIAGDGLIYPNECRCSDDGQYLFVNETFGRRLSRFAICDDGSLADRQTIATFGRGDFPDGLTADGNDGWLVTTAVSNKVLHVDQGGDQT
ncbi:MAG: SMP-30/gluconolactonase/LRE family protein, partial [Pseudomonadota bacterium]